MTPSPTRRSTASDESDEGPSRAPTMGGALRRYFLVALLPVVLFAAAGVVLAVRRPPVYTATSQLNVGVPDASSSATPGYVLAAQDLATSYSREATSDAFLHAVGRRTGLSVDALRTRISSSAVPETSAFAVHATGATVTSAVDLARTATRVLAQQIDAISQPDLAAGLLSSYRSLQARANALSAAAGNISGSGSAARTAKLAAQSAQLEAQAAASRYSSTISSGVSTNLAVLGDARTASSDYDTIIERYVIVGVVAGILAGLALAFIVSQLAFRRRRPT